MAQKHRTFLSRVRGDCGHAGGCAFCITLEYMEQAGEDIYPDLAVCAPSRPTDLSPYEKW